MTIAKNFIRRTTEQKPRIFGEREFYECSDRRKESEHMRK
jgi:hypothetical protein